MNKVIVAASTHWDREWYRTFSDFRIRLCSLFHQLLDLLETDQHFCCYSFDGQSVVLEDYLEVYPENRQRIEKLVAHGRLAFGPLYNLPDEFLSSGEALIRNFLIGDEVCRQIGGKMRVGYVPDNFGHVSQLPQILNGVGLDNAFFFRGCNIDTVENKEFLWRSPDGSEVLGEYMLLGYWSLKSWGKLGQSVCDHFQSAYDTLKNQSVLGTVLLINGSDHLLQDPDFTAMLKEVKERFPQLDICNNSMEAYADLARESAKEHRSQLKTITGELRDFRYGPDPNAVTSCRSGLKRELHTCLTELERYCEPLCSVLYSMGEPYPHGLIDHAWKNILKSLGHDGISGCSSDAVIQDIHSYIRHGYQTAARLSQLCLEKIASRTDTSPLEDTEQYLMLFNPLGFAAGGITEQVVHIEDSPQVADIALFDLDHIPIEFQLLNQWEDVLTREFPYNSKERIRRKCFRIRFQASPVPALGFAKYIVKPLTLNEKRKSELYVRLQHSHPAIENEYFTITVNPDASINVLRKEDGYCFQRLNTLVSRGEVGDEYQHVSPLWDEHVFAAVKSVGVLHNSPLASSLKIRAVLSIPEGADPQLLGRSPQYVDCPVEILVTLYQNSQQIDFEVQFENKAKDHILYAQFPTGFINGVEYSHVCFDEVERDPQLFPFDPALKSTQSLLMPMHKYAGIAQDGESLNVMTKGLYEYHVKRHPQGADLYLTLLRSTSYMFHGLPISWLDGQHSTTPIVETFDSREYGLQTFHYSVYFKRDNLAVVSEQYAYPLRGFEMPGKVYEPGKAAPESFISVDSPYILLSTVKQHRSGDGLIVRLYNTLENQVPVTLTTPFPIQECSLCTMLEHPTQQLSPNSNSVSLNVDGKKIITLLLKWS